jgi:hypothetical protein
VKGVPDKLKAGVKVVFSENGEARNVIYSYVWRQVCSNGLIVPSFEESFRLSLRRMRYDFRNAVLEGIQRASSRSRNLAHVSARLATYRVFRKPDEDRNAAMERTVESLAHTLLLPREARQDVQAVWASSGDRTLYGLQNAITSLARSGRNEKRADLERAGGRLVALPDSKLTRYAEKKEAA